MDYKDEIIETIRRMARGHSVYNIFQDWVEMLALAFSNQIDIHNYAKREKKYLEIANKYNSDELHEMCKLNALLTMACEVKMEDVLGYIYMHLEISSNRLGQFFTPYHLCQLLAHVGDYVADESGRLIVNEPSCGAGGNIIALAERLKDEGINYQSAMRVVCQDLDWKAIHMCYVQMCMYGIPAKVIQGDTLQLQKPCRENIFVTPQAAVIFN